MRPTFRFSLLACCMLSLLAGCQDDSAFKKDAAADKEATTLKLAQGTEGSGDMAGAETLYKQAAKNSSGGAIELAEFYIRQHKEDKAITALNSALQADPKNALLSRALANLYIHHHAPAKALSILESALKDNPEEPLLYNSKGVALDMLGRYPEAQKCYLVALGMEPEDAMTFKANMAMSYILEGAPKKAIALLAPEITNPDATPTIRQNLALAYGLTGQKDKVKALEKDDLSEGEIQDNLNFYHLMQHENPARNNMQVAPPVIP